MASIHRLLDTFGPPPREICLDWAYQIQAAAPSAEAGEAAATSAAAARNPATDESDWTALEVSEDGLLELEGLTASMARSALAELGQWLAGRASSDTPPGDLALEMQSREIEPAAETFRASASLDPGGSDRETCRRPATRKRRSGRPATWIEDPRRRLTAAVLLAAVAMIFIGVWIADGFSASSVVAEQASSTAGFHSAQRADRGSLAESPTIADTDLSAVHDNEAIDAEFTTSDELTGQALQAFAATAEASNAVRSPPTAELALPPSLAAKPSDSVAAQATSGRGESAAADDSPSEPAVASQADPADSLADPQKVASMEIGDVMSQVASAVAQADSQSNDSPSQDAFDDPDSTHQPPLMLTRDASPLRSRVARGLARRWRGLHWTARLELPEEFICDPLAVQSVEFPAGAQWRIYDKDAKSPRACIVVSVRQRSGRDLDLEWSLRGSAEDFPHLQLPVAPKWLDGLSVQLKVTAASLRAAADAPMQNVPREMRSLVQSQRQFARQQLAVAERLLTLLADINRLASLLDDELLGHAELRESDSGEIVIAYGTCDPEPASSETNGTAAD